MSDFSFNKYEEAVAALGQVPARTPPHLRTKISWSFPKFLSNQEGKLAHRHNVIFGIIFHGWHICASSTSVSTIAIALIMLTFNGTGPTFSYFTTDI